MSALEFMIHVILAEIKSTVKNPSSKAKLKHIILEVFTTIKALYADDPDFA
jgi:hypothetical protein